MKDRVFSSSLLPSQMWDDGPWLQWQQAIKTWQMNIIKDIVNTNVISSLQILL